MRGDHALAAAPLPPVGRDREPLDVAGVGHGDHHVLFGDQVLDREFALIGDDLGAPLVPKPAASSVSSSLRIFMRRGLERESPCTL